MSSPENQNPNNLGGSSLEQEPASFIYDCRDDWIEKVRADGGRKAKLPLMRSEFNNLVAPQPYKQHSLIRDRHFFTFPEPLLGQLVKEIGAGKFDSDLIHLERLLARICGDHRNYAGFWRGQAFRYPYLHEPTPFDFSIDDAQSIGLKRNQAEIDRIDRIADTRINSGSKTTRGYLGWLLTNREFLNEHDALLTAHAAVVAHWGIDTLGLISTPLGFNEANGQEIAAYSTADQAFFAFLQRWQLQYLEAPYLPVML